MTREFGAVLQELRDDSARYFGTSRATIEPVQLIDRHYSRLLKVRVRSGRDTLVLFIKKAKLANDSPDEVLATRNRIAREFETTLRVRAGLRNAPGLTVPRPVACFPEHGALVTEEARGSTLDALLRRWSAQRGRWRDAESPAEVLVRTGAWLRAFQSVPGEFPNLWETLDDMHRKVDGNLSVLVERRFPGVDEHFRGAVMRGFDNMRREVLDAELSRVIIHGDFFPENILVHGTTVTVLDFETVTTGAAYHDAAMMYMYAEGLKASGLDPETLASMQRAMLKEVDPDLTPDRPLFRLLLLHHVIARLRVMSWAPSPALRWLYRSYVTTRYRRWIRAQIALVTSLVSSG